MWCSRSGAGAGRPAGRSATIVAIYTLFVYSSTHTSHLPLFPYEVRIPKAIGPPTMAAAAAYVNGKTLGALRWTQTLARYTAPPTNGPTESQKDSSAVQYLERGSERVSQAAAAAAAVRAAA